MLTTVYLPPQEFRISKSCYPFSEATNTIIKSLEELKSWKTLSHALWTSPSLKPKEIEHDVGVLQHMSQQLVLDVYTILTQMPLSFIIGALATIAAITGDDDTWHLDLIMKNLYPEKKVEEGPYTVVGRLYLWKQGYNPTEVYRMIASSNTEDFKEQKTKLDAILLHLMNVIELPPFPVRLDKFIEYTDAAENKRNVQKATIHLTASMFDRQVMQGLVDTLKKTQTLERKTLEMFENIKRAEFMEKVNKAQALERLKAGKKLQ